MLKGIHHTGISVRDLNQAVDFYQGLGSFTLVHEFSLENSAENRAAMGVANASAKVAWLKGPTAYLELLQFEHPGSTEGNGATQVHDPGIRHICLQSQDGEQLFDRALELGASSHARPAGLGTGNLYSYIRDPFDNVLELEGLPYAPKDQHHSWYAHAAYVVRDMDAMLPFYEAITGTARSREGTFGPGEAFDTVSGLRGTKMHGAWIPVLNGNLEFWQYLPPTLSRERPAAKASDLGYSHVCFEVDDLKATVEALKLIGTRFLTAPVVSDTVSVVYGLDPEENLFELISFKAEASSFSLDGLSGWSFLKDLDEAIATHYNQGG